jgi:hypothetical protein
VNISSIIRKSITLNNVTGAKSFGRVDRYTGRAPVTRTLDCLMRYLVEL